MRDIDNPASANADQIRYWNSSTGTKWVEYQRSLDTCFQNVNLRLLELANLRPGERVLDIGCGTGATTIDISEKLGESGGVVAVDVSQVLIDLAIQRSNLSNRRNIEFILADAQSHGFDTAAFDLLLSRFGVMFFDDPFAAFKNMGKALHTGGRVVFVCWADVKMNPWFEIPKQAAISQLGKPQTVSPRAPGPLAFSEIAYVREILSAAGLKNISIQEEIVQLRPEGNLDDAANLACNIGPATRILKEKSGSEEDFINIKQSVIGKFKKYYEKSTVSIPATLNFVICER